MARGRGLGRGLKRRSDREIRSPASRVEDAPPRGRMNANSVRLAARDAQNDHATDLSPYHASGGGPYFNKNASPDH